MNQIILLLFFLYVSTFNIYISPKVAYCIWSLWLLAINIPGLSLPLVKSEVVTFYLYPCLVCAPKRLSVTPNKYITLPSSHSSFSLMNNHQVLSSLEIFVWSVFLEWASSLIFRMIHCPKFSSSYLNTLLNEIFETEYVYSISYSYTSIY